MALRQLQMTLVRGSTGLADMINRLKVKGLTGGLTSMRSLQMRMGKQGSTESVSQVSALVGVVLIVTVPDSMLDGTPTLRLNEFMLASIDKGMIPLELPENERNPSPMPAPEEIVFELDKHVEGLIERSKKGFGEEMKLQDLKVSKNSIFGKLKLMCM